MHPGTTDTAPAQATTELHARPPWPTWWPEWLRERLTSVGWVLFSLTAGYLLAYLPIFLVFGNELPAWAALLIVILPIGAAGVLSDFLRSCLSEFGRLSRALIVVVPAIVVGYIGYRAFSGLPTKGFGFFAFVTVIVVIGQGVSWARYVLKDNPVGAYLTFVPPAAIFLLGVLLPDSGWSFWLMLLALILFPVSVAIISEAQLHMGLSPWIRRDWISFGVGGALLVGGSVLTMRWIADSFPTVPPIVTAAIIMLVVFVLMLLTCVDNIVDLLLVAIVLSLFAFYESEGPTPVTFDPAGEGPVLVSLGDSYMSGEGVGDFYDGTNEKGTNECRRSQGAYPELMTAPDLPPAAKFDQVIFLACSGADAINLTSVKQFPEVPPQLDQLDAIIDDSSAAKVSLVVLSIGGNDAGFGEIARTCVIPGDCVDQVKQRLADIGNVEINLQAAYQQIKNRLVDMKITAPVLVIPYPVPIERIGCGWSSLEFDASEHAFLSTFTNDLNNAIIRAAGAAGFYVLDDMTTAFVGDDRLAICSIDPESGEAKTAGELGVNFIGLGSVAGSPGQISNPQNWFHNSMHPNAEGHQAMRDALAIWLQKNPVLNPTVRDDGPAAAVAEASVQVNSSAWMYQNLARFIKDHVGWLLMAGAGAWMLCMRTVHWSRSRRARKRHAVVQA